MIHEGNDSIHLGYRPVGSYSFTPYAGIEDEHLRVEIELLKARIAELERRLAPPRSRRPSPIAKWLRSLLR
jgi:hypothetical protein